jgi:hypothetical protein
MRRTGDLRLALVLSALAVTSCTDPHAGSLPTASPSPTATASSTASATASSAGDVVVGVARTYYATLERSAADPASKRAQLAALVDRGCQCHQVVELLDQLAAKQHRLLFEVTTASPRVGRLAATSATVFISVDQSAGREVDAAGKTVRALPATTGTYALDLVLRSGRWLVAQISRSS